MSTFILNGQNYNSENLDFENTIENILSLQNEESTKEELYETLMMFYLEPIDINNATADELNTLYILSKRQIQNILNHIKKFGPLISLYELQSIPSFDEEIIKKLLPFITIKNRDMQFDNVKWLDRIFKYSSNYFIFRYEQTIEDQKGYLENSPNSNAGYLGDKGKYYTRLRIKNVKDFGLGFTAEKDSGEKFDWNKNKSQFGADFNSGYLQLENRGRLKNMIIGDYQIQYGQSLVFGAGYNIGKGAETINTIKRHNLGVIPYTSTLETNFFRGVSTTFQLLKNLELTNFYSNQKKDAVLNDSFQITSFLNSGFHRTETENKNKKNISEENYGGTLLYKNPKHEFSVGSNLIITQFSNSVLKKNTLYSKHNFENTNNYTYSIFGDWVWENINIFSEFSSSKSHGKGMVLGVLGSLSDKLETSILFRNYSPHFHSFYSDSFGSNTNNTNEIGWYWGLKYRINEQILITAYIDSQKFPWLKFNANAPSKGLEYLTQIAFKPNKVSKIFFQIRTRNKEKNVNTETTTIKYLSKSLKNNYQLNFDYQANDKLTFRSRVQWSNFTFTNNKSKGFALWQDINLKLNKIRLSGRYIFFDTDNFENAQYAFEKNVLFMLRIPAYYGLGYRYYVLLKYTITKKLDFWIRYSQTNYRDRDEIGSGNELIKNNKKSNVTIQFKINL